MDELGVPQKQSGLFDFLILALILGIFLLIVPMFLALSQGGFTIRNILDQFLFYAPSGAIALALLAGCFLAQSLITKGDSTYGNSIAFANSGEFPAPSLFRRFRNPLKAYLLGTIIFLTISTVALTILKNQTLFGIGQTQEAFGPVANLLYAFSLVPASENLGAAFLFGVCLVGLAIVARKKKISKFNFAVIYYLLGIGTYVIFGLANHLTRYAASDQNLMNVAGTWAIGGLITSMTGSFIWFWTLHQDNNLVYDLKQVFSNDLARTYAFVIVALLCFLYWYLFMRREAKHG